MSEIILAVLGGSALAALINQIGETFRAKKKHQQDCESTEGKDIKALKTAMRFIMLDRIRWLGQAYIREKCITFDDRRLLNEMHDSYHNGLDGNGDLDTLMAAVNSLPLKIVD